MTDTVKDGLREWLAAIALDSSRNVYFDAEPDRLFEHRITTKELVEICDALAQPDVEKIARECSLALADELDLHDAGVDAVTRILADELRRHLTAPGDGGQGE